jgi:DNA-binding XRE family transcriptional regulator
VRHSPTPQASLGAVIRSRRTELGLKPDQLADLAQLTHRTLDGIEAGTTNPTWATVKRLAHALDWTIADVAQQTVKLETDH